MMILRDPSDENLCSVCLDEAPHETPEPTAAAAATQDDDATDPEMPVLSTPRPAHLRDFDDTEYKNCATMPPLG